MDYSAIGRQYRAALRDRNPKAFENGIRDGFAAGHLKPSMFSIRRLFESLVENASEILSTWAPGNTNPVLLSEADNHSPHHLLEAGATVSSAFSNITGQIVYNAVLEAYQDEAFVFTPLVANVPTQFNGERIPGVTRAGDDFESIGENQPYPYAGVGEDWIDTPQTVKRGEIVAVSREAVFFDRTGLVLERCKDAGNFYGFNKEKRIIDAVVDENVTTHRYNWKGTSYATFQSTTPWVNVLTNNSLVDWSDIDEAERVLSEIVDPHTGEPVLITPKHLVVTRQLKATARQIVTATQVRKGDGSSASQITIGLTPLDTDYSIVSSALLATRMATDTDWYIGDIGKAVKYMENWPMQLTEAPPSSEVEFTHDIVKRWKVSERGAAVVVDPRGLVKSSA